MYRLLNTKKGFLWNSKSFLSPIDLVQISTTLLRLGTVTRWGAPSWRGCESPTYSVSLGISVITREVTSPDWSWFYEADKERESFARERIKIFPIEKHLVIGFFACHVSNIWPDRRRKFVSWRIFGSLLTRLGLVPAFKDRNTALRGHFFYTCTAFRDLGIWVFHM